MRFEESTELRGKRKDHRGAMIDGTVLRSRHFKRRAATHVLRLLRSRGLKPHGYRQKSLRDYNSYRQKHSFLP